MADFHPSDYFCTRDADEDLKAALQGGDQSALRKWCRENPDKLRLALDWVHPQHSVHRDLIALELDDLRRKDHEQKYKEIHGKITSLEKPHWTTTPGFWVSFLALILAGLASWFAWLAIPAAERPYSRLRSSTQTSSSSTPQQADSQQPTQPTTKQ